MGSQVWSMEKLENKLVDMRDMYESDPNNSQKLPGVKVHFQTLFLLLQIWFCEKCSNRDENIFRTKFQARRKIHFTSRRKTTI